MDLMHRWIERQNTKLKNIESIYAKFDIIKHHYILYYFCTARTEFSVQITE